MKNFKDSEIPAEKLTRDFVCGGVTDRASQDWDFRVFRESKEENSPKKEEDIAKSEISTSG